MKISYIHAICLKNDAISNSIRDEITWLKSNGRHEVRLYAHSCDYENLSFSKVNSLRDVVFDVHFQQSDLVVFHFGITYSLFNLFPVVPKEAKRLVVFHNITPKEFLPVEKHPVIEKSFQQMANIVFADHVVCDSQTNLDVLSEAGIHVPATLLSLAVHSTSSLPESKPSFLDGVVRLAFVGRFVRSKGPQDLLESLGMLLERNSSIQLMLDMVGNISFSDAVLLDEILLIVKEIHQNYRRRVQVNIHGDASEELKMRLLQNADLFVLPTYHEGFCVPIVEALSAGCQVIAYENSNTPAISGGFARLVPTGDVAALSYALEEEAEKILSPSWQNREAGEYLDYKIKVQEYVGQYSPELTKERFLKFIQKMCQSNLEMSASSNLEMSSLD